MRRKIEGQFYTLISAIKKVNQGNRTGSEELRFELVVRESLSEKITADRNLRQEAPTCENLRQGPSGQTEQVPWL